MKDWTGNKKSTWATLGANNHCDHEREVNDFYATSPQALEIFLDKLKEDGIELHNDIWECACGEGHLSKVLENRGYRVLSTDLIDRGYGNILDFFECSILNETYYLCLDKPGIQTLKLPNRYFNGDILTNPPYRQAKEFVEHALDILEDGYYAIFLLKIQFLEGKARKKLFEKYPPKYVYVHSERQICAMNGNFENIKSSASYYAWFIWEKGYKGELIIRWI